MKRVFIDMDNVLVDFKSGLNKVSDEIKAPWKNPSAWSDKVEWVTKYLDDVFHKKMVITHCKDLCLGDFLIDDRDKNGTKEFAGEWIHFGSEQFPNWESVLNYLVNCRLDD